MSLDCRFWTLGVPDAMAQGSSEAGGADEAGGGAARYARAMPAESAPEAPVPPVEPEPRPVMPVVDSETEPMVAWALVDANGSLLAEHEAARPFYAASTIKLHVLLAALRAADAGTLDLDASVPATRTSIGVDDAAFTLAGDHLDPTHPADGTSILVRDLLVRMIDRSSNEATNMVIDLVGLDAVAVVIDELGLQATRVQRRIGDGAALARGLTNETCAADLAETMRRIVQAEDGVSTARRSDEREGGAEQGRAAREAGAWVLAPGARELALEALRSQRMRVILDALPAHLDAGSKSGEVDGFRHDVAFIGDPGSPDLRCLAVMTCGLSLPEADDAIRDAARELLEGIGPTPATEVRTTDAR